MNALAEELNKFIDGRIPVIIRRGKVTSLDLTNDVCGITPKDGGADYKGVKLRSITKENAPSRFVVYPKVGSDVLFGIVQNNANDAFVIETSEIDNILIEIDTTLKFHIKTDGSIDIKSTQVKFNDGSFGGIVKVTELVSKLNTIESSLNTLKALVTSWVTVPGDGGAALKALLTAWAAMTITPTTNSMIHNTKVIH
jgi:hypothetical protein